ncbi:MAG: DUF4230 domain-containing protein [Bacteroidales bacterium]|nr:DUF4230 domain-containing protein [Bacteroidales bacterium]
MKMNLRWIIYMAVAAALLGGCSGKEEPPQLYQELKAADKLVLASMSLTKTARLEDSQWYKIGKRIAVYSYDSYLEAFIDMSLLKPEDVVFDDATRTVRLTLPPVEVELAGRDMQMRKVYENIGVFRSDIDPKERAAVKEQANRSLKKELEADGGFRRQLEETARRKARKYFESLLESQGYTAVVDFRSDSQQDVKSSNLSMP